MRFEWDEAKARANLRNHGVSFPEAEKAFDDPKAIVGEDDVHSKHEPRYWLLGESPKRRLLLVIFTERHGDVTRIITAWKANREEHELYENQKK